jgi:uncharacterized SAM-binding protein YcdF (DUF218 family)
MWRSVIIASLFLAASTFTGCSMKSIDADSAAGKALQPPLQVQKILVSKPFHPDSVSPGISFVNTSGQILQSIKLEMLPYNGFKHKKIPATWQEFSGPVQPANEPEKLWGYPWRDATVYCAEIKAAEIIFNDGSKLTYSNDDISKLLASPDVNYCKPLVQKK